MRRRKPYRFTSPWRPPAPAKLPSAPARHWLDRHEEERERLDEELNKRLSVPERVAAEVGQLPPVSD